MTRVRRLSIGSVLGRAVCAHALGRRAAGVVEAVYRAAFVYGSAPTSYLSLRVRLRDFEPADLDREVLETRELVRVRAMRGSVYLLPRSLVPHALALTPRRPVEHYARVAGIRERDVPSLCERIERILERGSSTAAEIREALGRRAPAGSGLSAILGYLGREARIVRTAIRGGIASQTYEYARMADWIELPDARPSPAEALRALAPIWLRANGPASAADLAWWAGTSKREAASALAAIGVLQVEVAGLPGDLLATEEVIEDLAQTPARNEVDLVPCWDSYLMAHRDRSRYLPEAYRPFVIDRMGNVTHVVLAGGRVAGIWDVSGSTLLHAPFDRTPRRALEAAARRLAPLHEFDAIEEVAVPEPLSRRPRNAFLAPLRRAAGGAGRLRPSAERRRRR